jgi:NTE family protein
LIDLEVQGHRFIEVWPEKVAPFLFSSGWGICPLENEILSGRGDMKSLDILTYMGSTACGMKLILSWLFSMMILNGCMAHYPHNQPISSFESLNPFFLKATSENGKSNGLLFILTFSGGGTRAAAFSYGVLKALAEVQVMIDGEKRRIVDEVDVISSVSGGSFTAAYYGVFGDRIFEDFETRFLKHDVQKDLTFRVFSPLNWFKLGSLYYDRSDLAAEYYDELLFENKTFSDFDRPGGLMIAINATDAALGSQFTFSGSQFAPICTDLATFPVSRAVAASSAVPGVFSSIILRNHAGSCDFAVPPWTMDAIQKRSKTRRYVYAKRLLAYLDTNKYPYIHLFDGGISDNLGIRTIINSLIPAGDAWKMLATLHLEETTKLVVMVVNSHKEQDVSFAKKDYSIPFIQSLLTTSAVPLDHYSFESLEILKENMRRWEAAITAGRCGDVSRSNTELRSNKGENRDCAAKTYFIEVSFDLLQDLAERERLKGLPTSFRLEGEDVDRLIAAAKSILENSSEFQSLINDLR